VCEALQVSRARDHEAENWIKWAELRFAFIFDDYEAALELFRDVFWLEILKDLDHQGGRGVILRAPSATLELFDREHGWLVQNWIVLYEEEVGSVVVYERASMHPGRRLTLEADVTSLDRPTGSSESLEQVRPTTPQTRHPHDDEVAVVGQVRVASA
jgi:hypothetical protein